MKAKLTDEARKSALAKLSGWSEVAGSDVASRVSEKPCSARPDDESGMLPGLCINGDHDLVRTEVELDVVFQEVVHLV